MAMIWTIQTILSSIWDLIFRTLFSLFNFQNQSNHRNEIWTRNGWRLHCPWEARIGMIYCDCAIARANPNQIEGWKCWVTFRVQEANLSNELFWIRTNDNWKKIKAIGTSCLEKRKKTQESFSFAVKLESWLAEFWHDTQLVLATDLWTTGLTRVAVGRFLKVLRSTVVGFEVKGTQCKCSATEASDSTSNEEAGPFSGRHFRDCEVWALYSLLMRDRIDQQEDSRWWQSDDANSSPHWPSSVKEFTVEIKFWDILGKRAGSSQPKV